MPYVKLPIQEGFYTEDTRSDSAGRWIDGDHIRFVTDVPEKIGGWVKLCEQQFLGICRGMETWPTFDNDKYMSFGTNLKLYIYYEGQIFDITPYRTGGSAVDAFIITASSNVLTVIIPDHGLTTGDSIWFYNTYSVGGAAVFGVYAVTVVDANTFTIMLGSAATFSVNQQTNPANDIIGYSTNFTLTNPFSTTVGSDVITVTSPNNGCTLNDFVFFQNASTVAGLDLNGEWQITNIVDSNTFQFIADGNASATVVSGGGTVYYLYEINTGVVDESSGYGYGIGGYGQGTYGTPRTIMGPATSFPRIWTMDVWQDDLVACPRDGGIYYWVHETVTIVNRAVPLPNAPAIVKAIAVAPDTQVLIAFGATDLSGNPNPMLIRTSSVGSPVIWEPNEVTNTAATFQLTYGNQIMQATKMRGQILISTDQAIYSFYTDAEAGFAYRMNTTIQVMSPNSMVEANGIVIIFGEEQFFIYDGTLRALKCDVRQKIFFDINYSQTWKVYGAHNTAFNEIWWFYPSGSSSENDDYVIYNYQKNIWYYGTMPRTAFTDTAEVIPNPIAAAPDGFLYSQESGFDADGSPLIAFLESGDVTILERNKFAYVKNVVPNLLINNTPIQFEITVRRFPQSPPTFVGNFIIYPYIPAVTDANGVVIQPQQLATDVIGTRAKGGQVSVTYTVDQLGAQFKGGDVELLIIPTGTK